MTRTPPSAASVSDTVWLVRFANGDPVAARALTERLAPKAFGYALRLLRDRAEAEDVTQEALLRLWKQAPVWRQDGPATPRTWLLRVVRNLCIDRLRRTASGATVPAEDDLFYRIADPSPSAAEVLLGKSRTVALETALETLPARQREAVVLRHLEELANPEIATVMDISVEAVESLIARGKRSLNAQLAGRRSELGFEDDPRP